MEEFPGTLRLIADAEAVGATALLANGGLRLRAGSSEIGRWDLGEVEVEPQDDGLHIRVEDEELVFTAREQRAFASAVQRAQARSRPVPPAPRFSIVSETWERIPDRWRPVVVVVAVLAALGVVWPVFIIAPLALAAGVGLLAGIVTALDPLMAVRLPGRVSPALLLGVGGGLGVLLIAGAVVF